MEGCFHALLCRLCSVAVLKNNWWTSLCSPWAWILTISSFRRSTFSCSCLFFCSTFCRLSVRDLIFASCWTGKVRSIFPLKEMKQSPQKTVPLSPWRQHQDLPGRRAAGRQSTRSQPPAASAIFPPGCSPAACCASPWSSPLTSSCWCRGGRRWTLHQWRRCSPVAEGLSNNLATSASVSVLNHFNQVSLNKTKKRFQTEINVAGILQSYPQKQIISMVVSTRGQKNFCGSRGNNWLKN